MRPTRQSTSRDLRLGGSGILELGILELGEPLHDLLLRGPAVFAKEVLLPHVHEKGSAARNLDADGPLVDLLLVDLCVRKHGLDEPARGLSFLVPAVSVLAERHVEFRRGTEADNAGAHRAHRRTPLQIMCSCSEAACGGKTTEHQNCQ